MPVSYLDLENFKSYAGKQRIGPFSSFTSVIGPNGSGKSNLMDAISFVLGVQSRDLRSQQMKDLIHRPEGKPADLSCRATLVFETEESHGSDTPRNVVFSRCIAPNGNGTYQVDGDSVSFAQYSRALESIGVLVQAKNFLVFQGDVEALARKTPTELVALVENISGSAEWKKRYEEAEAKLQEAEQAALFGMKQQKGLRQERKMLQQQKQEADRFDNLLDQKRTLQKDYYLWQLYHIEQERKDKEECVDQVETELNILTEDEAEKSALLKKAKKAASAARRKTGQAEKQRVQAAALLDRIEPGVVQATEEIRSTKERLEADRRSFLTKKAQVGKQASNLQAIDLEIQEAKSALDSLQNDYDELKKSVGSVDLTGDQEEEYERVREAAAAASTEPRRILANARRRLETSRSQSDSLGQELKEAERALLDLRNDVAQGTDRTEKLSKVRVI